MTAATVLIVEDDAATRRDVRGALEEAGHRVLEASDASTAMAVMSASSPDLVVLGMALPDMDVRDLVPRLRALPRAAEVPIIGLSSADAPGEQAAVLALGLNDLLAPPVSAAALLARVDFHLAHRPRASAPGAGRHVLVVDDEPMHLRVMRRRLEQLGFRVTSATNGAEALDLARADRPDVILSDVLMPKLDGFGLSLAVRRDRDLRSVRVVLVSSQYLDEADRLFGTKAGADAYVEKTPDLDGVVSAVLTTLGAPSDRASLAPEPLRSEHADRVTAQLERQVALNAALHERCLIQSSELAVLGAISEALTQHIASHAALYELLATCLDVSRISRGALYELQPDGSFVVRVSVGYDDVPEAELGGFFGQTELLRSIVERGEPVTLPSDSVPEATSRTILARVGVESAFVVPVLAQEERLGALLFASRTRDLGRPDWPRFARTVAGQLGQAIALSRAFERVASSETRFRTLVDSMHDSVFTLDREQRHVGLYGGVLPVRGSRPEDFLGRRMRDVVGAERAEVHEEANLRALEGESVVYEWTLGEPTGDRQFQVSLSPMRDSEGTVTGIVGVGREITEQRHTQSQLLEADRMASIGLLSAGVAHEINNPLAALVANLEYMRSAMSRPGASDAAVLEDLVEPLEDAEEAAERVRNIVRDLKVFSRPDEERGGPVDVRRIIESSLRMAWNEIRHRARVEQEYGDLRPVQANEARLGQVFLNLIINAAQSLPEGQADRNVIRIEARNEGDSVVVRVSDTGPGVPPEILERIFNPFFTTKPVGLGTGLGLAICKRIVVALGGDIGVESKPGQGAVFRVVLPAARDPHEKVTAPTGAPRSRRRGRILVVDDEVLVGKAVTRLLGAEHDLVVLTSAEPALERIVAGEIFDVILCDLMMPIMTGMELYAEITRIAPQEAEKIVFLTGGAFTPRAESFLDGVPNVRIDKPFDGQSLRALIEARLA